MNGHTEVTPMKIDFLCENCTFSAPSKVFLEEHIKSLSDKCDVCDEKFHTNHELKNHRLSVHPQVKCGKCNLLVKDQEQLDQHVRTAHEATKVAENQAQQHKCDQCDYMGTGESTLNDHKANFHDQNRVTVDQSYIEGILAENEKLKSEINNLRDDFDRLNEIFESSRNSTNYENRNDDVELSKVREEYRLVKTEN